MKKAVVLLSGGLDSATVLAVARSEGFHCLTLGFDYGQRHKIEQQIAVRLSGNHKIVRIDNVGGSALVDEKILVPKNQPILPNHIPVTYVPARNTIFLSYALAYAEVAEASDIFIGVNALDYSGYPDCRPEYIEAFERMADLATRAGVEGNKIKIHTPLIKLSKAEIIRLGVSLGVDYSLTISCYDPIGEKSCGACDSCQLRVKGFKEAGIKDPTIYV
jgi:7-cyano-7-deazaguanine synthase